MANNLRIEGARIGFKNFTGKEGKYNLAGRRNFCVFVEHELGVKLQEDGWNVRWLKPRDESDDPQACLSVAVNFDNKPPKIVLITQGGRSKTNLEEESVSLLDWADIEHVDLVINPYEWGPISGKSGIKAYLKSLYVTLVEDEFESKYYDVPDSADNSMCNGCLNVSGSCAECRKHNGD